MNNIFLAVIPFWLFGFVCAVLTRRRFSARVTRTVWGIVLGALSAGHLIAGLTTLDNSRLISLMPLTAYLPAAIACFALSRRNLVGNLFILLLGGLAALVVDLAEKLWMTPLLMAGWGIWSGLLNLLLAALVGAGLGFAVFRMRKILLSEPLIDNGSWYIPLALFLLCGLSLYQADSTRGAAVIILLLLVDATVFAVLLAFIRARFHSERLRLERERMERQIAVERAEYRLTEQKLELGRRYRHDMRHHFAAIRGLIRQGDTEKIGQYLDSLGEGLREFEQKTWCKNAVVNAVLSALIDRAAQSGVEVEAAVNIPAETAIDSADICAAVANTLENALNACLLAREEDRKISIRADYGGQDKFTLAVENGVREKIPLGEDGLPKGRKSEEHGYGLDSVRYIAEKYSGFFVCQSGERTFAIRLVLFGAGRGERAEGGKGRNKPRLIAGIAAAALAAVFSLNCMPGTVSALESLPGVGPAFQIIDFRNWGFGWGSSGLEVERPVTDEELEAQLQRFEDECKVRFVEYLGQKYSGYVWMDIQGKVERDGEDLLILSMSCTVNLGSSLNVVRYFVADRQQEKILALSDLFGEEGDFTAALDAEILRQIGLRTSDWEGEDYQEFYGWGIWTSEYDQSLAFTSLADERIAAGLTFTLSEENELILRFDEDLISPGRAAVFLIPAEVTDELAAAGGPLDPGGRTALPEGGGS